MKVVVRFATLGALLVAAQPARAQTALPLKHAPAATKTAITPAAVDSAGGETNRPALMK